MRRPKVSLPAGITQADPAQSADVDPLQPLAVGGPKAAPLNSEPDWAVTWGMKFPAWERRDGVIAVQKLDGSRIYLNEDLIERVEDGADGQSAVYLINGGHIIVANDSNIVVERIRSEKVSQLRRVHNGPQQIKSVPAHILTKVKEQ